MHRLVNPIQSYAWGSHTAIADLLGQPASDTPQAELWMGAHRSAPSGLAGGEGSLLTMIEADPVGMLGAEGVQRYGPRLPFLVKLLAAEAPLSLQAHPDAAQAAAGYAAEQARGLAVDAPGRNYRDGDHKPELICALTPFEALCGLRPVPEVVGLLTELAVPPLAPHLADLQRRADGAGVRALLEVLLRWEDPSSLVAAIEHSCRRHASGGGDFAGSYRCALDLAARYPADPGVVIALLLNLVRLRPGQALYLSAGTLHAYLRGVGVEVMANSDNVLRGGLTGKHVDARELLRVLDPTCAPVRVLDGVPGAAGERDYPCPAGEFRLSRCSLTAGAVLPLDRAGPQLVLVTEGTAVLRCAGSELSLRCGESAFVSAAETGLRLTGTGTAFHVTTGPPPQRPSDRAL